jgi:hypothetical protein
VSGRIEREAIIWLDETGSEAALPRDNHAPAEGVDAIVPIKVWLLGINLRFGGAFWCPSDLRSVSCMA